MRSTDKYPCGQGIWTWGLACILLFTGALAHSEAMLSLDEAFDALGQYEYGESRVVLRRIETEIVTAPVEQHDALMVLLTAVLEEELSVAATEFVCKQLALIADGTAVPALEPILHNPETSHLARYALEAIPDESAERALIQGIDRLSGAPLQGVIHSLGTRQSDAAVAPLTDLLAHQDTEIVQAAASALGRIGSESAQSALEEALDRFAANRASVLADALMTIAEVHRSQGRDETARALYQRLQSEGLPPHIQAAAYGGQIALMQPLDAVAMIGEAYHEKDDAHAQTVTQFICHWPDDTAMSVALAELLDGLTPQRTVWFLQALRDRGDASIRDYVTPLTKHGASDVRSAAYEALAVLGNRHSSLDLLNAAATAESSSEQEAARKALHRLPDPGVPAVLTPILDDWLDGTGDASLVVEAVHALMAHHAVDATPLFMKLAVDGNDPVAMAAYDALAALGDEAHIAPLLRIAIDAESDSRRDRAIAAAAAMGQHIESPSARLEPYRVVLEEIETNEAAETMLMALAQIPAPEAIDYIEATAQAHPETLATALLLLSERPTLDALDSLLTLGAMSDDDGLRAEAVNDALRLLALPTEASLETLLTYYERVLDLAPNADSIARVFEALPVLEDPAAVALVQPYLDDHELDEVAQSAIARIRRAAYHPLASHHSERARNAVDGSRATRWATGEPQSGGEWFMMDLGAVETISGITIDSAASPENRFRGYAVYLAEEDPDSAVIPMARSDAPEAMETIEFPPSACRYIRIEQTGSDPEHEWAIHEIRVHRVENN